MFLLKLNQGFWERGMEESIQPSGVNNHYLNNYSSTTYY